MNRAIGWIKADPIGSEFADVILSTDRLSAVGVAIGSDPVPYRLDYQLETTAGFVTSRLRVLAHGQGWSRSLDLRREPAGAWISEVETDGALDLLEPGGALGTIADSLDCDLGLSPLTNSMPMLRHQMLEPGPPVDFTMALVSVPDLSVRWSRQRYTFVRREGRHAIVRYASVDDTFTAELTVDADGIVLDYPGIGRALGL